MISLIVATAKNGVIGKDNKLPWSLPAEMAIFRKTTSGHPIIMGRRTYESIGRPLPNRTNIVITRNKDYLAEGITKVTSWEEALEAAKQSPGSEEILVIGGQAIFDMALPHADRIYLTKVDANVDGDTFFKFDQNQWQ